MDFENISKSSWTGPLGSGVTTPDQSKKAQREAFEAWWEGWGRDVPISTNSVADWWQAALASRAPATTPTPEGKHICCWEREIDQHRCILCCQCGKRFDGAQDTDSLEDLASYVALRLPENLPLRGDRNEAKQTILRLMRRAAAPTRVGAWLNGGIESFSEGSEPPEMVGTEALGNGNDHFGRHEQNEFCERRGCVRASHPLQDKPPAAPQPEGDKPQEEPK
jgi:hypothetical protein